MSRLSPKTLTDSARALANGIVSPIGALLARWRVHPDTLTILGTIMVLVACVPIASGQFTLGAIILMLGLPFDVLDGAVARAMNRQGKFGALLDSSLDRYADGFIFAALSYYFAVQNRPEWLIMSQAALLGTFLVSYLRARAEGIGVVVKIGLFSRMERTAIILPMLLLPSLLELGVLVLAIGTNVTTMQRFWYVYKTLKDRGE